MAESKICVGVIAGPHGVRGLLRVKSFTQTPENIAAYGPLTDADGRRRFEITLTGTAKGVLLARIAGIADRDAAEALRGTMLYADRDALPQTGEDEYYHADLIGLPVERRDGSPYGTVRALYDFGAGDMIEIALAEGGVVVLPFTRAVAPVVVLATDEAPGRIVVEPPIEDVAIEDAAVEKGPVEKDATGKDTGKDGA